MNKLIILGAALVGLSSLSFSATATSDDSEYPAAYFQPKVVYIDKDAVKESGGKPRRAKKRKAVFDPKYPAAYFEPKVIYP